jgi:hypothetical protein
MRPTWKQRLARIKRTRVCTDDDLVAQERAETSMAGELVASLTRAQREALAQQGALLDKLDTLNGCVLIPMYVSEYGRIARYYRSIWAVKRQIRVTP